MLHMVAGIRVGDDILSWEKGERKQSKDTSEQLFAQYLLILKEKVIATAEPLLLK